jgi:3-oxoacyl-[acyl-carrier protein] reductase
VTGGTRGIGAAITEALLEQGARVCSLYKQDDAAAERLRASLGVSADRLDLLRVDVTDDSAVEATFARLQERHGRLDILVYCAGAAFDALLLRTGGDRLRSSLRVNLEAPIACARRALPLMLRQHYGRIVHVTSVVAAAGNPGQTAYAAAKGGVEAFARSLAREVGSRGITVNCVSPGLIETEMTASLTAEQRSRALEATAVGRAGTPREVASAVTYLCSEAAGYITGVVLQVNGGMYM